MARALRTIIVVLVLLAVAAPSMAEAPAAGKSVKKALLLSLILPGAGQAYLGNTGRAKAMLAAEAGVWAAFAAYRIQGGMREDRYKEMARLFAGVEREMNDDYYLLLAYYLSSEEFNVDVMRDARLRYPGDREAQLEFFEAEGYFGDEEWQWDSLERLEEFSLARTESRHSYRRATLTTGFAVLNRMISMVDIYLSTKLARAAAPSAPGLGVDRTPEGGIRVYLRASF
jgi:hypothetical protein